MPNFNLAFDMQAVCYDRTLLFYEPLEARALSYHKNHSTSLPSNSLPFASKFRMSEMKSSPSELPDLKSVTRS